VNFVDGFERGGAPRVGAGSRDGLRDRTKWLCSYAIARLAASAREERPSTWGAHLEPPREGTA